MIKTCSYCGGLYVTDHGESFAGTPCDCPSPEIGSVAPPVIRSTDGLGALQSKQTELLREVWGITVARVRPLCNIDDIAREWKHLADALRAYATEAEDRYKLHAPNARISCDTNNP